MNRNGYLPKIYPDLYTHFKSFIPPRFAASGAGTSPNAKKGFSFSPNKNGASSPRENGNQEANAVNSTENSQQNSSNNFNPPGRTSGGNDSKNTDAQKELEATGATSTIMGGGIGGSNSGNSNSNSSLNYDIWLESDFEKNVPLDWRLPVGVLIDKQHLKLKKTESVTELASGENLLLKAGGVLPESHSAQSLESVAGNDLEKANTNSSNGTISQFLPSNEEEKNLSPWSLTVHFQSPPATASTNRALENVPKALQQSFTNQLTYKGLKSLEHCFMNSLREAVFLYYSSCNAFMRFPKASQTEILDAIYKNKFEQYWVNFAQVGYPKTYGHWKFIPVKFHFREASECCLTCCFPLLKKKSASKDRPGENVNSGAAENNNATNQDESLDPQTAGGGSVGSSNNSLNSGSQNNSENVVSTLADLVGEKLPFLVTPEEPLEELGKNWTFKIVGIDLALDTPLHWLCLHLSYFDHFLHIVVARRT